MAAWPAAGTGGGVTPQGGSNLAFLPLCPALIRGVHEVTGLGCRSAAVVSAQLSLVVALVVIHRLLVRLYGLVPLWPRSSCSPRPAHGARVFMGYSESLFLVLSTLLALHRRAWLTAGGPRTPRGLTRPTAVGVAAALTVAAVGHPVRERRCDWRPVAAVVLGVSGMPLYLWWVGRRVGRTDGWFLIQDARWGTHWDYGRSFVGFLGYALVCGDGWVAVSTAMLVLGLVMVAFAVPGRGSRPQLIVYGFTVIVLALGQSNYFHSKLRMLVPALIFLVPPARALAETRPAPPPSSSAVPGSSAPGTAPICSRPGAMRSDLRRPAIAAAYAVCAVSAGAAVVVRAAAGDGPNSRGTCTTAVVVPGSPAAEKVPQRCQPSPCPRAYRTCNVISIGEPHDRRGGRGVLRALPAVPGGSASTGRAGEPSADSSNTAAPHVSTTPTGSVDESAAVVVPNPGS
ncbi:hypothetical protein [Streptomyces sp. NPDC047043]|uniref:hypothetical protein n=1 Tax=Streptomyces sp. NPDC047043 TaxID=3154497 RepID=UPI0033D83279